MRWRKNWAEGPESPLGLGKIARGKALAELLEFQLEILDRDKDG